ncbi:MAG TPA: CoA pyrophosphatase [Acidimicrobiia bacterium]|nr:CoA pyrophosphatase [Acidimicrobiia bacterium]
MWDRLRYQASFNTDSPYPRAAVLVPVFADGDGELRLVLTKRPDTMPTHAGHISFPGGRPHDEDDGPVATALREAEEEVGIDPGSVEVLGFLPEIHTVEYQLLVVPVVGRLASQPILRPSPREVARVLLPRLVDLAEADLWRSELWGDRRVWFFEIDGEILWGATARMVRDLLALPR